MRLTPLLKALALFALLVTLSGVAMGQAKAATSDQTPTEILLMRLDGIRKYFPAQWQFELMDEATWAIKVGHKHTKTAFTDLGKRTTFLRQSYVIAGEPNRVRHTLLHEAGHVSCSCWDEQSAEIFAFNH